MRDASNNAIEHDINTIGLNKADLTNSLLNYSFRTINFPIEDSEELALLIKSFKQLPKLISDL